MSSTLAGPTTMSATTTTEGGSDSVALPDGFPAAMAPTGGATIIYATSDVTNGKPTMSVGAGVWGTVEDVFEGVKEKLINADFEIVDDSLTEAGDTSFGSISASGPEFTAAVTVAADRTGDYDVLVTMDLTEV